MSNGNPTPPAKGKKRFVIKQGDTYYLTTGTLLEYNLDKAVANGKMPEVKGVAEMMKKFKEEHDKPHTYYHAVDFTDVEFKGVNTGP